MVSYSYMYAIGRPGEARRVRYHDDEGTLEAHFTGIRMSLHLQLVAALAGKTCT